MQFKQFLDEVTLIKHPERGIEIRPSGGLGSWTIDRLVKDTANQLNELSKKISNGDFSGAEYIIFKNPAFKAKLSALAAYDKFKTKQGKRPVAQDKEIDLGESEMKYKALAMAKELHTALAELTFIEMLSVMDPKNPAKKEVQELETMINKLTTNVGDFIQKHITSVADASTSDVNELPDEEEEAEDKTKPKSPPKAKEDKMKNVKDKKEEIKESFRTILEESCSTINPAGEKPFRQSMDAPKKKYPAIGTLAWEKLPKWKQEELLVKRGHKKKMLQENKMSTFKEELSKNLKN